MKTFIAHTATAMVSKTLLKVNCAMTYDLLQVKNREREQHSWMYQCMFWNVTIATLSSQFPVRTETPIFFLFVGSFGVKNMPTLRSLFNFEQFNEVLQRRAHAIALDAVRNLNQGDVRIVIHGPRLSEVGTGKVNVRFYANHVSYFEEPTRDYKSWWGFDVEDKFYLTSNHCTKISFSATEGKEEETKTKILAFIDKIMTEASIKPVPRFSLKKQTLKPE